MASKRIVLTESLVPRLKARTEFDNDRVYVDYVYESIREALKTNTGKHRDIEGVTVMSAKVSPTYRIKEIYESTEASKLSNKQIKEIMAHAVNIKKVQNSLCQRGTTVDKLNFYMIWSLYEQGLELPKIFEITDKNDAWDTESVETVMRKIRKWAVRFNWKRK